MVRRPSGTATEIDYKKRAGGMSSRIGALPYSCRRAAFISTFLSRDGYLRFKSHSLVDWKPCDSDEMHRTTLPGDQVQ
jgi:hypothetical protein